MNDDGRYEQSPCIPRKGMFGLPPTCFFPNQIVIAYVQHLILCMLLYSVLHPGVWAIPQICLSPWRHANFAIVSLQTSDTVEHKKENHSDGKCLLVSHNHALQSKKTDAPRTYVLPHRNNHTPQIRCALSTTNESWFFLHTTRTNVLPPGWIEAFVRRLRVQPA